MVALGQQVQRLRDPAQLGVDSLGRDVQDAAVAHSCHTHQNNNYLLLNMLVDSHKLTLCMVRECQMTRRLVTRSRPLSPEFPFVSSMLSSLSIRTSPGLIFICLTTWDIV